MAGEMPSASQKHPAHSREPSLNRDFNGGKPYNPGLSSPSSSSYQPRPAGLERKPSASYGHHRQTSIVHGVQHSRNASFVTSHTPSPLSPPAISAAGGSHGNALDPVPLEPSNAALNSLRNGDTKSSFSSQTSTLVGDKSLPSPAAQNDISSSRRLDRTQSVKIRRDHSHHHSHSRHQPSVENRTVGEYALHHLFNSFLSQAEQKLKQCSKNSLGPEPHVEEVCGPGVDLAFDQLVAALGHVARQKPKPLIDSLMFWRKDKAEAANRARAKYDVHRETAAGTLIRRNTEPVSSASEPGHLNPISSAQQLSEKEAAATADRQSIVAIFLLCRVLMEIIRQSNLESIGIETTGKLEEIIFNQLKQPDPEQLAFSPMKMANWKSFSQLLGRISEISFDSISDRFFTDLDRFQADLATKGPSNKDTENALELLVLGIRHACIKTQPDEAWRRSCDFMMILSKFFVQSHGQRIKLSYCSTISKLLWPIAGTATTQFNSPEWKLVLDNLGSRVNQLMTKPRYWHDAFPLFVGLLCVAPSDTFSKEWLQTVLSIQPKLKDRATRSAALQAICRLTWTYIYRIPDGAFATARKIEEVIKIVFPPGKKTYTSLETAIAEPLIEFIRIVGFKNQDVCFRSIIFPLLNSEMFLAGRELRIDMLEPDKMVIAIRAFLAIMSDLEKGDAGRPPLPINFSIGNPFEKSTVPPLPNQGSTSKLQFPLLREERLSRPVNITGFGDAAKSYYNQFCEILGKITLICDNAFGGQAVLDEKFNSATPKTPMSDTFGFSRRDDHQIGQDPKQSFYDLLHVAVQALPRCLSAQIQFSSLINLLCTGTAHVQDGIAHSSAQSLKSIARQGHAQQVVVGFARFIFNFDDRYSTMSEGGMLGPGHIENTLQLYVQLLQIWLGEIRTTITGNTTVLDEVSSPDPRGTKLDRPSVFAYVDDVESHALFFLCSQSRRVRSFAVTILRLITEFDGVLGGNNSRIIHIMEKESILVMDFKDEYLSVAERSRLQRGMRKNNSQQTLVELCSSDITYDATLWFKIFPNLMRISFERCPLAVSLGREHVCARLTQMYKSVNSIAETAPKQQHAPFDLGHSRAPIRTSVASPEFIIDQFKLYLIFVCTTLTNTGFQGQTAAQDHQHARKPSKSTYPNQEKITTARSLFGLVVPLLSVGPSAIREAVVLALGSININLYKPLLESLQSAVAKCSDDARLRMHQRTASSPRRSQRTDRLRTEITNVYRLTSRFLQREEVIADDWILHNLVNYTKDLKIFLSDADVQNDWEFQKLRRHYCGLIEELFDGINRTSDPTRWMPFEARKSAFTLMEDWCGLSPNVALVRQREESMKQMLVETQRDAGDRNAATTQMEIEKRNLKTAALSAMAALCAGPVGIMTQGRSSLQFDIRRMLAWIDAIFGTPSDRMHAIGRRAMTSLIAYNPSHPYLLDHAIEKCYVSESSRSMESYFEVVNKILLENLDYPSAFWRTIAVGIFTLGNEKSQIRSKSAHLLRVSEERLQKNSKIQDYDVSVSDKTAAVYKLAQFEISKRLAHQHSALAFFVFSDLSRHFKSLQSGSQRNIIAAILPWMQIIELQVDSNGAATAPSYMLLVNLFEITIRFSSTLQNEVQALWQALATGPHAGNVQLVLDFIIQLCLEKREQNFVDYAKQVVVFLASTPAGSKVVEFLMLQINPKNMVQEKREPLVVPSEAIGSLPYVADLGAVLPIGNKQAGFSLGQLSMILLVDLMVSPLNIAIERIPLLLQVVFVLWDHYIALVQEQARDMLIHLIHELVISKFDEDTPDLSKQPVENLIEAIRSHDSEIVWAYDDSFENPKASDSRVPAAMENLAAQVLGVFTTHYPNIRDQWGRTTLSWATSCPVRHLACRSFQVFRCVLTSLDQPMLADMLARLSNTIADTEADVVSFSMEILTTLKSIVADMDYDGLVQYPQLFWATCACLNTIHEQEFLEALSMLEHYIDKVDLGQPSIVTLLTENIPSKWEGEFEGVQPLVYKGLRSSTSLDRSLEVLAKLSDIPDNPLLGGSSRILFAVLANLPRFMESIDNKALPKDQQICADRLGKAAEAQGCSLVARALVAFSASRYRSSRDFIAQTVLAIRESFFPMWDFKALIFLIGLLTNKLGWFKTQTMRLLCVLIPDIDMHKTEIASHGPDLISPLLRLLQTEHCPQALEVLDKIMTMSGTPNDKHHLRMSMVGSQSRAARKEYDRMQSLFGIPEESGWAIPIPAAASNTTRANVHAVFYICFTSESPEENPAATPDVEFHVDEFRYEFPFPDRTGTMMSDDERGDGNMGELVQKLDSLDDFFDDNTASPMLNGQSNSAFTDFVSDSVDESRIYDQQTLPILQRTLARTNSASSLHTGFVDGRPRDPLVMSPTAFTTPAVPSNSRPRMRGRSITTPAESTFPATSSSSAAESLSDTELETHAISDHDRHPVPNESSFFLESMIRPVASGARSGMRRLTGGGSREEKRMRDIVRAELKTSGAPLSLSKSPKVPKLPPNFVQGPQSP